MNICTTICMSNTRDRTALYTMNRLYGEVFLPTTMSIIWNDYWILSSSVNFRTSLAFFRSGDVRSPELRWPMQFCYVTETSHSVKIMQTCPLCFIVLPSHLFRVMQGYTGWIITFVFGLCKLNRHICLWLCRLNRHICLGWMQNLPVFCIMSIFCKDIDDVTGNPVPGRMEWLQSCHSLLIVHVAGILDLFSTPAPPPPHTHTHTTTTTTTTTTSNILDFFSTPLPLLNKYRQDMMSVFWWWVVTPSAILVWAPLIYILWCRIMARETIVLLFCANNRAVLIYSRHTLTSQIFCEREVCDTKGKHNDPSITPISQGHWLRVTITT